MNLSSKQKRLIREYFDDDTLSELFEDVYYYQQQSTSNLRFESRERIIGFGCEGEHLRGYIAKTKIGFIIKLKTIPDAIDFTEENADVIKECIDENDQAFEENIEKYILTRTVEDKPKQPKSRKSKEKRNIVLSKLKNRNIARKFTKDEFNELADWDYCRSFNEDGYIYTLPNGNKIECDSKSELAILDYLVSKKLALEIGGQELCIPYDTAFRESVTYHPDLVILTKDYHIAIIEVKPVTAMSNHTNIEKYRALKEYCDEHRYEYMMVDPDHDYMTYEELQGMHIPKQITKRVDDYLVDYYGGNDCLLEKNDISVLYEDFEDEYKKGEFELYLHALVVQRGWYNFYKNGFKVYEKPKRSKPC